VSAKRSLDIVNDSLAGVARPQCLEAARA